VDGPPQTGDGKNTQLNRWLEPMADCKICEILENKDTRKVYEDEMVIAFIPEKPCCEGHIKVCSKDHKENLEDLGDGVIEHIFFLASFSSSVVFEVVEAQGTNIIMNNGNFDSGNEHVVIDIVPRKDGDDIDFKWEPKQIDQTENSDAFEKIKDNCDIAGHNREKKDDEEKKDDSEKKEDKPKVTIDDGSGDEDKKENIEYDADNYLLRQLRRIP